jgi:hypothetical protein
MKALPMLDHVMLWYARIFTVYLLIREYIGPTVGGLIIYLFALIFLSWAISCWCLNREIVRLYLGLSAAIGMGAVLYLAQMDTVTNGGWSVHSVLNIGSIIGSLASLVWIAIRPHWKIDSRTGSMRHRDANTMTSAKRLPFDLPIFKSVLPSFR